VTIPHRASVAPRQNSDGARSSPEIGADEHSGGPAWLPVILENIPKRLADDPAWFPQLIRPKRGKVGKWDKIPADPTTAEPATWSDPSKHCTLNDAYMAYQRDRRFDGIGHIMHGAGVVGIDLDDSIAEDGSIKPWALEIVDQFSGAYWEKSISGRGLRGFCLGALPDDAGGRRSKIEGCSVEIYGDERNLVVTGQVIRRVDDLADCQEAVTALYERLGAGRVRATGTAIGTGLVGRLDTVPPEGMAILEAAFGGRHGARLLEIWGRDDLHVAGASEDDWALASEIAYQAIRRGHTGTALALLVEETMRAGPYRAKWDQRRGPTTWLAQDVANAIATVQKRTEAHRSRSADAPQDDPDAGLDEWPSHDPEALSETPAQIIARLERELGQARTVIATQQTVIRSERATRESAEATAREAKETVQLIRDVIAWTGAEPPQKLLILGTLFEGHSRASRGIDTLTNACLMEITGLKENKVSECSQDFADREGSPFQRWNDREWVRDADGGPPKPITHTRFRLACATLNDSLRAVVVMGPPSPKAEHAKETARERARKGRQQWGVCPDGDCPSVRMLGFCERHPANIVGDRIMTRDEFRLLEPPRHEIRDVDGRTSTVSGGLTKDPGIRDVEAVQAELGFADVPGHEVRDVGTAPVSMLDYAASRRPDPPPERCPAPGCRSMEFKRQSDGSWRCLKSGHDPSAYQVVPAVAGGSGWEMKRDPDLPPADVDVTGYRACCRTHGVIRGRGGHWTCADCGEPVAAVAGGSE